MKFTKLTSAVITGATLLSFVAPVATFAATPGDDANLNGGQAVNDQKGDTDLGVSFGDDGNTGNIGDLRLAAVPSLLDFGNHVKITGPNFNANGTTAGSNADNDVFAGYKRGANQTSKDVDGKVFVKVVDEQSARVFTDDGSGSNKLVDPNGNEKVDGKYDDQAGSWTLQVKSNGFMANNTTTINGGNLVFKNGAVTMSDGDTLGADGKTPLVPAGTAPKYINASVNVPLLAAGDTTTAPTKVMTAAAGEGAGTVTEKWDPSSITLALPSDAQIEAGEYTGSITWSLVSDVQ